ncbi:MAG: Flp family type IVb pilin [Nocardioides sp.]
MLDYLRIILDARIARMNERGASAVEYGLLITGIAGIIVLCVYAFGAQVTSLFSNTCHSFSSKANTGSC